MGGGAEVSLLKIDERLVFLSAEFENAEEAIKMMASEMRSGGYVRDSYCDAVLECLKKALEVQCPMRPQSMS